MGTQRMDRRRFLGHALAAGAAPLILPRFLQGGIKANDRLNVAIVGIGAMGSGHVHRFAGDPAVQVLAVCDVDAARRERAHAIVRQAAGARGATVDCTAYNDYRQILARPDIDAVVIATPDHWHALMSVDAARAGKDVYCEKPISVTIEESRSVVNVIRRHARVFQTGTQYRSIPTIRRVCQFVRDGGLGKVERAFAQVTTINGWLHSPRFAAHMKLIDAAVPAASYAPVDVAFPPEPVPAGLDWDLWVGPARWLPYNRMYHENPSPGVVPWAFAEAFGAASNTWHLSHSADVVQYALGQELTGPVEILHPADGLFPTLTCRYANGTLLHFVDHWGMLKTHYPKVLPADARVSGMFGGVFVGERGWVTALSSAGPITGGPPEIFRKMGMVSREVHIGTNSHHANFIDCVHTRAKPSAHEEIGHRSACLGHLLFIACRLGRSLKWDPATEQFPGNAMANRLRSRAMREPWMM